MCSLSIINTHESSILEKYFSKLSVISNAYIYRLYFVFLLAFCLQHEPKLDEKKDLERERKEGLIEHAQGHIRQRQKIRLNTPVIIVVLVHATWLLSSLRVASYASRAETSHAHENLPLYILPLRGNFSREEKKLGRNLRDTEKKETAWKKEERFSSGDKGDERAFPLLGICEWVKLAVSLEREIGLIASRPSTFPSFFAPCTYARFEPSVPEIAMGIDPSFDRRRVYNLRGHWQMRALTQRGFDSMD